MMLMKIAVLASCGMALLAQQPVTHTETFERRVVINGTGGAVMQGPITADFIYADIGMAGAAVKNAPYSADAVSETVQMLADGNKIARTTTSQLARDGEGRTMRRDKLGDIGSVPTGKTTELTFINDPVAGVNWILEADTKTARKLSVTTTGAAAGAQNLQQYSKIQRAPSGVIGGIVGSVPSTGTASGENRIVTMASERRVGSMRQVGKMTDLGKQMIEGVECVGKKSTITIEAGAIGNERAIDVVSENWYSPELQTTVYTKRSDPRSGETTYKLTNIQRAEPSRILFEVPADYTVKEGSAVVNTVIKHKD
jgi:hypothetical protein